MNMTLYRVPGLTFSVSADQIATMGLQVSRALAERDGDEPVGELTVRFFERSAKEVARRHPDPRARMMFGDLLANAPKAGGLFGMGRCIKAAYPWQVNATLGMAIARTVATDATIHPTVAKEMMVDATTLVLSAIESSDIADYILAMEHRQAKADGKAAAVAGSQDPQSPELPNWTGPLTFGPPANPTS